MKADDLRDHAALELHPCSAPGTGGVPHAEHQGNGAQLEQGGSVPGIQGVQAPSDVRLAEHHPVQLAVPQQGVGDAVGSVQAGNPEGLGQVGVGEVHRDHRQRGSSRLPLLQQRQLHPVGLGLDRVQEDAGDILAVQVPQLGGVAAALIGGREYLVPGTAGGLVLGDAAEGSAAACQGIPDVFQAEGFHGVGPPPGVLGICLSPSPTMPHLPGEDSRAG